MQPRVAAESAQAHLKSIAPGQVSSLANQIQKLLDGGCSWLEPCPRFPASQLTRDTLRQLVEEQGMPAVFENCMPQDVGNSLFSPSWLVEHYGDEDLGTAVRNVDTLQDLQGWTHGKYIQEHLNRPLEHRRGNLYAKDVTVPPEWTDWFLKNYESFYAYASTDLIARLPKSLQPCTLMAYIGCEGNRTPAHIDMIGAVGHNLMTYADPGAYSIWFLSKTSDRPAIMKYMLSKGAHLIHDSFVLTLADLEASGVKWTVLVQRFGDFVFVPPDSCHQVINGGEKTIKVAWNRYTPLSLAHAIRQVLPIYHDYLKPETYRTKTIVQHVIQQHVTKYRQDATWTPDMRADLEALLPVLEENIFEETTSDEMAQQLGVPVPVPQRWAPSEEEPLPHSRVCNYCCNDIWQRWYNCSVCPDEFDICLQCVAQRRGCVHGHKLRLCEFEAQSSLAELVVSGKVVLVQAAGISLPSVAFDRWSWGSLAFRQVVLNSRSKNILCHCCRRNTPPRAVLSCCEASCGTSYCHNCLFQKHGIIVHEASKLLNWSCPRCTKACRCLHCRRTSTVGAVSRETLCALLGSAQIVEGPPLSKWYNRPPPLQTHFGPEVRALKLLGPCDIILPKHGKTPDIFSKLGIEEDQSDCSDEELLSRVSASLKNAFQQEWMPGLNRMRSRLFHQFFPLEQPRFKSEARAKARSRPGGEITFTVSSDSDPVASAILNRTVSNRRVQTTTSPLLCVGVALVDCPYLPSWPAALLKNDDRSPSSCSVMLLGVSQSLFVPTNRVRPCQSMEYWLELANQSCRRDLPDFAKQANVSYSSWRSINRQFSKAVSEAVVLQSKIDRAGDGASSEMPPSSKRRKLDADSFI